MEWVILERRGMAIFPVVLLMRAYTDHLFNLVGSRHRHFIMDYREGFLTAWKDAGDWEAVSAAVYQSARHDPTILDRCREMFLKKAGDTIALIRNLSTTTSRDQSFFSLFERYCEEYPHTVVYGECIPYTIKERVAKSLLEKFDGRDDAHRIIALFCTPERGSFAQREENAVVARAIEVQQHPDRYEACLQQHMKEYEWLEYDYDNFPLDENRFRKRFDEYVSRDASELSCFLSSSRRKMEGIAERRRGFVQATRDVSLLADLSVLKKSTELMELKKEIMTQIHYGTYPLFCKLADEIGVNRKMLSYILPGELQVILGRGDCEILLERYHRSSVYISRDEYCLLRSEEMRRLDGLLEQRLSGGVVKGLCSSPGRAVGRVRVVRTTEDVDAFQRGEVLLSTMTTVDYLSAMKKASAIVTDDGGIICHAAIISRELDIPSIVGTRNATLIYKTGDMVVVDADKGIIEPYEGNI